MEGLNNTLENVYANETINEITEAQFIAMLQTKTNGHFAFSMVYFTNESKCSKKTPLNKRSYIVGFVGSEFSTKVTNQAKRENENAEIEVSFNKASYEKINVYLGVYPKNNEFCLLYNQTPNQTSQTKTVYFEPESNEIVTKDQAIENYFTNANKKPKEAVTREILVNGELQEQEQKFNWFAIKIKNIEYIKINKQVYKILK